jgi:hypothetical protein
VLPIFSDPKVEGVGIGMSLGGAGSTLVSRTFGRINRNPSDIAPIPSTAKSMGTTVSKGTFKAEID